MKKIKIDEYTVKEKKFYWWSGRIENLYNTVVWSGILVKITNITDETVSVKEFFSRKEYDYPIESAKKFIFKPLLSI